MAAPVGGGAPVIPDDAPTLEDDHDNSGTQPLPDDQQLAPSLPFLRQDTPRRRDDDNLPIICDAPLAVSTFVWQLEPGRRALVVVAKGTFRLEDGAAKLSEAPRPLTGGRHFLDDPAASTVYPSDFAPKKDRCDVTVSGFAYASTAAPHRAGFRVGDLMREVHIHGPRQWVGKVPSAPAPFERVPMAYENAFGGEGHPLNPHGKGTGASLPLIEDPAFTIRRRNDQPRPACLAPVPLAQRLTYARGTYDAAWVANQWPYLPADFDYRFYQTADVSQQIDTLVGDEAFEIWGMLPQGEQVVGTLPGVQVRVFASRAECTSLEEVTMMLDQCAFDMEARTVELCWRGHVALARGVDGAVSSLFVTHEPLAAPATLRDIERQHRVATLELEAVPDTGPPANDDHVDSFRRLRELEQRRAEALQGVLPFLPGVPGGNKADERREPGEPSGRTMVRGWVMERLASGATLESQDLAGADLSSMSLEGCDLRRADLTGVDLRNADLRSANLAGAKLGAARLTGACLVGACLDGADLGRATADDANFAGASLEGAVMSGVIARRATFVGIHATGSQWVGSSLIHASFERANLAEADFSSAVLDEARFGSANLTQARLYDATGAEVSFDEAIMAGARGERSKLERSSFRAVDATASMWANANLSGSCFERAVLTSAVFNEAVCRDADFQRVSLRNARIAYADLSRSDLSFANLMKANLQGACLVGANLSAASLYGAQLWQAQLSDANLERADLTGTALESER